MINLTIFCKLSPRGFERAGMPFLKCHITEVLPLIIVCRTFLTACIPFQQYCMSDCKLTMSSQSVSVFDHNALLLIDDTCITADCTRRSLTILRSTLVSRRSFYFAVICAPSCYVFTSCGCSQV